MPTTPQKKQGEKPNKSKKGRRLAISSEEIKALRSKAEETPQKKRLRLLQQEDYKATTRTLVIPHQESVKEGEFTTVTAPVRRPS